VPLLFVCRMLSAAVAITVVAVYMRRSGHNGMYQVRSTIQTSPNSQSGARKSVVLVLLSVRRSIETISVAKQALRDVFDDPTIDDISPAEMAGPYPAIRYVPPTGSSYLDIVTRLGDAFAFADLQTERVPFDGLTVTVVSAKTLYRMKCDTVRLKDRADADALKRPFRWESD
jgi:hypothetical protein